MEKTSLILLLALTFIQCQPLKTHERENPNLSAADSLGISQFLEEVTVDRAQNFSIENHETHKVAHIHVKSDQRSLAYSQKIIFIPRGQTLPKEVEIPSEAWLIEVPLQTVAANDDGEITRLTSLGLMENIIGMGGGGIYDTLLRKRWEEEKIASIGYSFHQVPKPEIILALNPDLLMLYSYNHERLTAVEKMRELGINAVPHFAWAEPSILGKAEWIKFTALFFHKSEEANLLFDKVVQRCLELKELTADKWPSQKGFMTYFPSSESDWAVHRNDFYASFLDFAGVENVLKDNGPNHLVGMNNERLLSLASEADVWITNSRSDDEWPPLSYLSSFKAYRNKRVYHYQKRTRHEHDAYDWYETPEVRPDLVIEDLVSIFYPDLLPEHELMFFDEVKLSK
ncbi:MAG: ABC transporter substrate-binding protein [Bacteroidota bacterium]